MAAGREDIWLVRVQPEGPVGDAEISTWGKAWTGIVRTRLSVADLDCVVLLRLVDD